MDRYGRSLVLVPLLIPLFVANLPAAEAEAKGVEFFEKKIRPVLIEHCYRCHSAEAEKAKKLKGGLLLDSRNGVRKGGQGGPVVSPGRPGESRLLKALRYEGDLKMPPQGKLPNAVVADFARWVEIGAPDPRDGRSAGVNKEINIEAGRKFWAFQPLAKPVPPGIRNEAWARTPIDRFILGRLEQQGLAPNPPAGREKLIRRAYFDLIGLPPTPEEIDAFVKDAAPDAYGRLIDRLLGSERYGERWGRHWLDVVRFAESGGYEFDGDRPGAYHYRDFVIKAFNQDMPYDQFVRWQLAGDHLVPGDYLATSATGFVVAGPYPGQTTAKTLEPIRYDHLDDMLVTASNALLGLTVGCARCHDHKFDPLPQQDYYRLLAAFGRTDSANIKLDPNPEVYRKAKAQFELTHAPLVAAWRKFQKEELPGRFQKWSATEMRTAAAAPWQILDPVVITSKVPLKKLDDGSLLAAIAPPGKAANLDTYTVVAHTLQKKITAIHLEALADPSLPKSGPGLSADGSFVLAQVTLTAEPMVAPAGKPKPAPTPVNLKPARATSAQPGQPLLASLGAASAVIQTEMDLGFDGGTVLTFTCKFGVNGAAIGRPRLAFSTGPRPAPLDGASALQNAREIQTLLDAEKGQLTDKNREQVVRWYRTLDPRAREVYGVVEQNAKQEPQPNLATVFAAASGRGGEVHFLIRGETERKNGVATPGYLQVLTAGPDQRWTVGRIGNPSYSVDPRAALGAWLTDTDQGAGRLLARVLVNRLWQHHFGNGIVGTPNDFGTQGERPTHPELLDWLAGEFIRGGWRLKPIHKLIMTSAVYTQASEPNTAGLKVDPKNQLYGRYPTRRLEAEAIRDAILAVSGSLDPTMYGPGTLDQNSPRRSVYLTVKRSNLIHFLQLFDAPEAIQSTGQRQATTAPTQALAMMNSPFVRQRAEKLAQLVKGPGIRDQGSGIRGQGSGVRDQAKTPAELARSVEEAYLRVLGRRPAANERDRMVTFIRAAPASDLALADFCHALLCSNEFVYLD